jgi:glucokinase
MGKATSPGRLYVGVDVGGTKILAAAAREPGCIVQRKRRPTPRRGAEQIVQAVTGAVQDVLEAAEAAAADVTAIGVGVPGVVDSAGKVLAAPNLPLAGAAMGEAVGGAFPVPVAVGNDCNAGALGEAWVGTARGADSVVTVMVGTGIGGGFVHAGRVWRGHRHCALEIGHMVMQLDGPTCGCGGRGCFEALASRTAIERQIRRRVADGQKTVLTEVLDGDLRQVRSGALQEALRRSDELVASVLRGAAEVLGHACVNVRHLFDPSVIVLGGGVIEACADFVVPIVQQVVSRDPLAGGEGGQVLVSRLGDDAVPLGAVALARERAGRGCFDERYAAACEYPPLAAPGGGRIMVGETTYTQDVYVRANGEVKKRKKAFAKASPQRIDAGELARVCKGGPEVLLVGAGPGGEAALTDEGARYLALRAIRWQVLPTRQAVREFNRLRCRRAALLRAGG